MLQFLLEAPSPYTILWFCSQIVTDLLVFHVTSRFFWTTRKLVSNTTVKEMIATRRV